MILALLLAALLQVPTGDGSATFRSDSAAGTASTAPVAVEQVPAPPEPDALAQRSAVEGWIWAERTWAAPAEPKDLAGGRFQALLGVGRWGYAVRADVSGMPGEFDVNKVETFRSAGAYLAVHRNLAALPGGIQIGLTAGGGSAVPLVLPEGSSKPTTAHAATYGAGGRIAGPGWWAYVVIGQNQALPGLSGTVMYQARLSSRTSAVGMFGLGARQTYVGQFGIAVRWF